MGLNSKVEKSCVFHNTVSCSTCTARVDSIFSGLEPNLIKKLNQYKTTNTYKKGQTIFYEGNPCPGLFCIASGHVKLIKHGAEGKETLLKIAKAGDILGIYEVVSNHNSNATAQVMEDTTICFVDKKFMNILIKNNCDLAFKVIQKMAKDLHDFENRLDDIQNKDVFQRIIKLLLILNTTHGESTDQGSFLNIRLTRAEMAAMVSTTPESVMRTLSELKALDFIRLVGKKIYLLDLQGLKEKVFTDIDD